MKYTIALLLVLVTFSTTACGEKRMSDVAADIVARGEFEAIEEVDARTALTRQVEFCDQVYLVARAAMWARQIDRPMASVIRDIEGARSLDEGSRYDTFVQIIRDAYTYKYEGAEVVSNEFAIQRFSESRRAMCLSIVEDRQARVEAMRQNLTETGALP